MTAKKWTFCSREIGQLFSRIGHFRGEIGQFGIGDLGLDIWDWTFGIGHLNVA